jgi:gas vesicle protein
MFTFLRLLLGLLVGSVFGSIIGMLIAPRSGKETRKLIKEEFTHRVSEPAEGLQHNVQEQLSTLKTKIQSLSDELEETGKKAVKTMADNLPSNKED